MARMTNSMMENEDTAFLMFKVLVDRYESGCGDRVAKNEIKFNKSGSIKSTRDEVKAYLREFLVSRLAQIG